MIDKIEDKYQQLTPAQKDIFAGYGLRQVKHFVEINLPCVEAHLPEGAYVQGINSEGKIQAFSPASQKSYIWISDQQWQEKANTQQLVDAKNDFLEVWKIFELKNFEIIHLSHIHRDFLASVE